MRYLLLLGFALMSPGAFAAADTATGTATDTATAPATTEEEKAALRGKFVDNWKATKENDDLLVDDRIKGEAGKDVNVSQGESVQLGSEVFFHCAEVSSEGRKDEVCKNEPNNPECAGVAGSIANATNCLEYFTPATLGCKTYGTAEFSEVEWFSVGEVFIDKMKDCKDTRDAYDAKVKDTIKLDSLTEMIGAGNYLGKLASGPSMKNSPFNPDSKISGNLQTDLNITSTDWESFASRVKDGASYLGYQDGDIIRASFKGESFSSIVTQSPFFQQKLNYQQKAKVEEGLADSKMISQRVVQSYREANGTLAEEPKAEPARAEEQSGIQIGAAQVPHPAMPEKNSTGGAVAPGSSEAQTQAQAGPKGAAGNPSPLAAAGNRAMTESERLEAVAHAATLARAEKKAYRSPANLVQSKVEDLLDTTLFHRISQTYRRKSSDMKIFDSRSGDLIRSIEKPEIFRNL